MSIVTTYLTALANWAEKAKAVTKFESGLRTTLANYEEWWTGPDTFFQGSMKELPTRQELAQAIHDYSMAQTAAHTMWDLVPADMQRFLKSPKEAEPLARKEAA